MVNGYVVQVGLCLLMLVGVGRAAMTREGQRQLAHEALNLFAQANEKATHEGEAARELYMQAALRFRKLIEDGGLANGDTYYNLGNAYLLSGDVGRAVLNYRRAQQYTPSDADIAKNLAFARAQRLDEAPVRTEKRVLKTVFFWHYDVPLMGRLVGAMVCWVVLWLAAAGLLWPRWRRMAGTIALVAVVGVAALGVSVVVDSWEQAHQREGVIVADEIVARQGDGMNYPPSFKEPLHAGAEFELLNERGGWRHIRLANGADAWIPAEAGELI